MLRVPYIELIFISFVSNLLVSLDSSLCFRKFVIIGGLKGEKMEFSFFLC